MKFHKKVSVAILLASSAVLTACSGSGGSSQPSVSVGTGYFSNLSNLNSLNNTCLNYTAPSSQSQCTTLGGTWSTITQNIYARPLGYVDTNNSPKCNAGTSVASVVCRVNGTDFASIGTVTSNAIQNCVAVNGTVVVNCVANSSSGSQSVGACVNYNAPSAQSTCSLLGGSYYSSLKSVSGSIVTANQWMSNYTLELMAGTNQLHVGNANSIDFLGTTPTAPVYIAYTIRIANTAGSKYWSTDVYKFTGSSFKYLPEYATPEAVIEFPSPVQTYSNLNSDNIMVEGATLYFQ